MSTPTVLQPVNSVNNEHAIRSIVRACVGAYASGFADRHIAEHEDEDGTINMKIHNVFIAALGPEVQYFSALSRSLDSSLGFMLERMAISIAEMHYQVSQHVEGILYDKQTDAIAELLEKYKRHAAQPAAAHYTFLSALRGQSIQRRHESDYYLVDKETNHHYLIELKIGGDLDNKKARSEKEALLEQYCILTNGSTRPEDVSILFATAYNRYGEGQPWTQSRVRQYFAPEELCIGRDFWNLVCKSEQGYDIVINEYRRNVHLITEALELIKHTYLPDA